MRCLILVRFFRAFGKGRVWELLEEQGLGEIRTSTCIVAERLVDCEVVVGMTKLPLVSSRKEERLGTTNNKMRGFVSCVTEISHQNLCHRLLCCAFPCRIIGREAWGYVRQSFGDIDWFRQVRKPVYLSFVSTYHVTKVTKATMPRVLT